MPRYLMQAKRLMRPRKALLVALVATLAVAAGIVFAPRLFGGSPATRAVPSPDGSRQLAHPAVPLNAYERQWRHWIRHYVSRSDELRRVDDVRRSLRSSVAASHAEIVRLNVWPATAPPSVELVVATSVAPAVYLKHDLGPLLSAIHGEWRFVEVVDRHGAPFFQNGYRRRAGHMEGMVGVPPALQSCSPVFAWGEWGRTPCPVS